MKQDVLSKIEKGPLILDLGVGAAKSTFLLQKQFPKSQIIGIDRSQTRLMRNPNYKEGSVNEVYNKGKVLLFRGDLLDWIRVFIEEKIFFDHLFIFYPNPYPKSSQINQRLYGSSVFSLILTLAKRMEVRSNWRLFLEEFEKGAGYLGSFNTKIASVKEEKAMTHFEEKYFSVEEKCYRLTLENKE